MLNRTRPEPLRSPMLDRGAENAIRHGFFTRAGGVSQGLYASLNVGIGSGDDPADVAENRRRVAHAMGVPAEHLVTVRQIHSPDVVHITEPFGHDSRPRADAMITDRPGLALGVLTADCGPVLFADAERSIVGAAHAGWKGALTGVLEATVGAMVDLGAKREAITAVLGPSIGGANYEVGPEFVARFVAHRRENQAWFTPSGKDGHALFDLPAYTLDRLEAAGVEAGRVELCTYAQEKDFFSFRRSTHRGEPDYGRQISVIVVEDM